jgi:apolipoprotein N-acyltransferase
LPESAGHRPLTWKAYFWPLLSGLLLAAAFPPLQQGYLAWVALIPLFRFCLRAKPRQAFAGGFVFAVPLHLHLNLYLSGVLFAYLPGSLALAAVAGLVLTVSLFYATFAAAVSFAARSARPLNLAFLIPALWLIMEYARSLGFLGYNVGYLGYTQWSYVPLLNLTALFGYWGLSFVMAACQGILLLGCTGMLRGKSLGFAAAALGLLLAGGLALPAFARVEKEDDPLWAALIQGNSAQEEILSPSDREIILQRYLELTRQAVSAEPRVRLVVWPETVVDLYWRNKAAHRPEMESLARQLGVKILYGARLHQGGALYNAIILLDPEDDRFQAYHKRRLVPFVEYFPLKEALNNLLELDFDLGGYTAGEAVALFDLEGIPLGGVVCFESYFGDYTRLFAQKGGRHLFVLTNDGWFGESIGLEQHAQVAAIRAVETGAGVTQVANSGITVSFDYRGRELLRSGKSERGFFILPLDLARRKTVYSTAGDYFPAFWALFILGQAAPSGFKRLRRRRPGNL